MIKNVYNFACNLQNINKNKQKTVKLFMSCLFLFIITVVRGVREGSFRPDGRTGGGLI